jgi:hypothetical protein
MTVWIYVDTKRQIGDVDHLKVFATEGAAEAWFTVHDPEGVAFEYPVDSTGSAGRTPPRPSGRLLGLSIGIFKERYARRAPQATCR